MAYTDCCGSLEVSLPGCQQATIYGKLAVEIIPFSATRKPGRPRSKKKLSSLNELVSGSVGCKRKLDGLAVGQSPAVQKPGVSEEQGSLASPESQETASTSISSQGSGSAELGGGFSAAVEEDSFALVYSRKVKAAKGLFDYNVKATMSEQAGYQTLLMPINVDVEMVLPQSSDDSSRKRAVFENLSEDGVSVFSPEEPECKRQKVDVDLPGSSGGVASKGLLPVAGKHDGNIATPDPARVSCKKSRRVFGLKRQDGNAAEVRTPKRSSPKNGDLLLGQTPPVVRRRAKKGTKLETGVEVRMSPRTKKLTDAMESYQKQREQRPPWTEVDLGAVRPRDCIGRSCKVFWPIDKKWYAGVIHEYQSTTKTYRIDYEDDEKEWLSLAKERVKLRLTPEERKALVCPLKELLASEYDGHDEELVSLSSGGYEKLTALVSEVEDFEQREYQPGDVLWAKVKGYPMWPAYLMDEERSTECGLEAPAKEGTLPLQFFGSYDYARVHSKHVLPFLRGLMSRYHAKCTRHAFVLGIADVYRYLKSGGSLLPEKMEQLQDEVLNIPPQDLEEDQDFMEEDKKPAVKKSLESLFTCPLELGGLTVIDFGKIVQDSEHFHNEHYIWPEGYKALRKFASMKDPSFCVDYEMEVMRNPSSPLTPLFRLSTQDGSVVEEASASACWDTVFKKVKKVKAKNCIGGSPVEEKRRKGPSLFGFSHPRISRIIQALPYARVCNKFGGWYEKPAEDAEELLPAGYKPVEVQWKHRDRCSVCYLDEEYADNLFLQCDKCRMLVHMNCYGEVQAPDGDLWLCSLCGQDSPKKIPPCCICPVKGGAMKQTIDGRWAHIACVMWIPETGFLDLKKMEKIDGVNRVDKERWKLSCSLCKVPYGACIQCSHMHCRTSYHPLCARAADFRMEVVEEPMRSFCKKHRVPASEREVNQQQRGSHNLAQQDLLQSQAGCARLEPYNHAARRGRREPEALAAALAKRVSVENMPYIVTGCRRNPPTSEQTVHSTSLWYRNWRPQKALKQADTQETVVLGALCEGEAVLSMSDRYRKMRSTVHERLTFGKSAIHGMGVFTKKPHRANEMVIEYAGEIVRQIVADMREHRCYDSLVGVGTYMFRIDNDRVVDATRAGSIAHLINHSCEPNCYSRVIVASGEDHIIIFSKEEIPVGVELTYDYRFSSKDELLSCYCGKPSCRGSVNIIDTTDEPVSIVVSRSELVKWNPVSDIQDGSWLRYINCLRTDGHGKTEIPNMMATVAAGWRKDKKVFPTTA